MAYQSLYRRYRPRRFSELRGQDHVARALQNAVREGRVGHAYLFSGPRGTGKTSIARILAKALNCTDLQDGEPCLVCDSCVSIEAGTSYDVQELDAASNNKVDDIADLIGKVALGSPGRTKVYILDEVHMLTPAASATLLKTLEEPPAHVVFVLATTDPHKLLPTIRSRTQHFDFHLLPADVLAEHVAWVIADAGLDVDEDGIQYVLRVGGGSARDTLSALDRVAAGGMVDEGESLDDLIDALAESDSGKALAAVSSAVSVGRDPRVLGEELLGRMRDIFLVRMRAGVAHLPEAEVTRVEGWAERLGDRATTRVLEVIGDALIDMRQAPDPRVPLEVALVRLTRPTTDASVESLLARVERLEQALASGGLPVPAAGGAAPPPAAPAAPVTATPPGPAAPTPGRA
ncbi:MAG TPA: DNA polymerase III subunit gamma/tau, partial [Pseudonocardia sp.]